MKALPTSIGLGLLLVSLAPAQDSLNCREKGSWPFGPSKAVALDSARSLAFCGSGGGAYVLDVSDPARPQRLSDAIRTRGVVQGLCYQSNRLYIAAGQAGLEIWDMTNPEAPAGLGYDATPGQAYGVAVAGNYAYVANDEAGLRVILVSDPAHPSEVGYCDTPSSACGVAVAGNYAYVADLDYGLRVILVSDPAHPSEVGYYDTDYALNVAVAGDYAYVADYDAGLRVISVSDPAHPSEVGYYDSPGSAWDVAVAGSCAYVADYWAGLQVIEFYGGGIQESFKPQAASPKPSPTVIRGVLVLGGVGSRQNTADRAELLDVSGRRVMNMKPGANDVSRLSPGVYFVTEYGSRCPVHARKVVVTR